MRAANWTLLGRPLENSGKYLNTDSMEPLKNQVRFTFYVFLFLRLRLLPGIAGHLLPGIAGHRSRRRNHYIGGHETNQDHQRTIKPAIRFIIRAALFDYLLLAL